MQRARRSSEVPRRPDADGLDGLTRRLARHREPIRAAIESMNGARFVHDRLELHGWRVEIADAQKVKGAGAAGLQDGAIFAFGTAGTNPKLLLAVELHGQDPSRLTWKYGLTRMTGRQLSARLDHEEVWSVPYVKTPQTSDTWWTYGAVAYYHLNVRIDGYP